MNQHKLTWGPYDDREPAYSHDGTHIAFASDRDNPLGGSYNIWTLDLRNGELKRITNNSAENHMPSRSPEDKEIAFNSTRDGGDNAVWAVNLADGTERKISTAHGTVTAPSWRFQCGKIVYHSTDGNGSQLGEVDEADYGR